MKGEKNFQRNFLYLTVFMTGAAVLVLEILGTRVVAPFYGTTIFVWTSLITVTLGALALGYFLGGRIVDKKPERQGLYGVIFLAGLLVILVTKVSQPVLVYSDRFGIRYGPLVAAFILFSLPLFLLGMVGPFVIRLQTHMVKKVGRNSGAIFAYSTVGSLVGAVASGFYLLPNFGLNQIFLTTGLVLVGVAVVGFVQYGFPSLRLSSLLVMLLIGMVFIPEFREEETRRIFSFVHHEQSFYGDLKIKDDGENYCLLIDGTTHSCHRKESNKPIWSYVLEIGRLVRAEKPQKVLVLGLGAGSIAKTLPEGQRTDFVEIDAKVAKLASDFFGFSTAGNQNLYIDDARHFLRTSNEKYDMIIMDTYAGNIFPTHLFTVEYLEQARERLNDSGVMLAFLEGKLPGDDLQLATLNRTANEVFESVSLTSSDPTGESFLLAHFSSNPNYEPDMVSGAEILNKPYQVLSINVGEGVLLTDDYNPLETIATEVRASTREQFVNIQGYTPFFSL